MDCGFDARRPDLFAIVHGLIILAIAELQGGPALMKTNRHDLRDQMAIRVKLDHLLLDAGSR